MAIKICLDAGHYGKYNQSPANKAYYESVMNWKLHLLLKQYLEQYGVEVITTRSSQATDLALTSRGAKSKGCDLFLSIHSNAVGSYVDETIDKPIVYVPLNSKGNEIGKKLAKCISDTMETKQAGEIHKRQGNNGDYYGVIRGAVSVGTVGLILEHSFHTNTRSTNWLLNRNNLDKLARAEAKVIADYYGLKEVAPSVLYKVQTGAYSNKAYADAHLAKVKEAGFSAFMVKVDNLYKIQVGAYEKKANADAMLAKVKKAGYSAFIAVVKK